MCIIISNFIGIHTYYVCVYAYIIYIYNWNCKPHAIRNCTECLFDRLNNHNYAFGRYLSAETSRNRSFCIDPSALPCKCCGRLLFIMEGKMNKMIRTNDVDDG